MKLATPSTQLKRQEKEAGRRLLPTPLAVLILGALLLACIFLAVSFGSIAIPVGTIAQILLNGTGIFHFARHWDPTAEKIVWQVRMPIVIGAACVGAALSTAGVLFQGMLRNPLAVFFLIDAPAGLCWSCARRAVCLCYRSHRRSNPRRHTAARRGCHQCSIGSITDLDPDA